MSIRGEVWPFLLRYYRPESTSEEREALRAQKRQEYAEIEQRRYRRGAGVCVGGCRGLWGAVSVPDPECLMTPCPLQNSFGFN